MSKNLTVIDTIEALIEGELRRIIHDCPGNAFIKFVPIAIAIEYLGACIDAKSFEDSGCSEDRFNIALKKLFPKKYEPFAKKSHVHYMFKDFRCAFVHQFRGSRPYCWTRSGSVQNDYADQ